MTDFSERSAYPSPEDFKVMRPEYSDPAEEGGYVRATINITPFRVVGESITRAGARRAALYEAQKTYRSYHASYRLQCPFPDEFKDTDGQLWKRVPLSQRDRLGDYMFTTEDGEEDYANIETMLVWDVRPETED